MEHSALSSYVETVRGNALATYLGLVASVEGSRVTREGGYTLVRGPGPFSFCNFAAGFDLEPGRIDSVVDELKRQSEDCFGFYVFVMSGDRPDDLEKALVGRGFDVRQRLVSMASTSVIEGAVEARLVKTLEERRAIAGFMARQFFWSMPSEAREAIAAATAASAHTIWAVGETSNPDAAVMLVEQPDSVGLFNLCVRPESRGKGLGGGLVAAVLRAANQTGRPVVLQCGEDLVGWYSSLGFESVGTISALTVASVGPGDILI